MHTVEIVGAQKLVSPTLMTIGDIAVVVETGDPCFSDFIGHVIVRTFNEVASLTNPASTWGKPSPSWPRFKVRILPAGTKITITVGE